MPSENLRDSSGRSDGGRAVGAYVCRGCGKEFRRDDFDPPSAALETAWDHVPRCEAKPEIRFDPEVENSVE